MANEQMDSTLQPPPRESDGNLIAGQKTWTGRCRSPCPSCLLRCPSSLLPCWVRAGLGEGQSLALRTEIPQPCLLQANSASAELHCHRALNKLLFSIHTGSPETKTYSEKENQKKKKELHENEEASSQYPSSTFKGIKSL